MTCLSSLSSLASDSQWLNDFGALPPMRCTSEKASSAATFFFPFELFAMHTTMPVHKCLDSSISNINAGPLTTPKIRGSPMPRDALDNAEPVLVALSNKSETPMALCLHQCQWMDQEQVKLTPSSLLCDIRTSWRAQSAHDSITKRGGNLHSPDRSCSGRNQPATL